MKRILLLSMVFSFVLATSAWAQRTVSGKVTDDNGEGLPGVNVVIKGTTTGVTTDLDGNYQISVPDDNTVLVFSSVGMATQEVAVGARSTIDLGMSVDTQELQEVVVTGVALGTSTKKLGFSVGKVNEDQLQKVPAVDPGNALRGKTAGVTIVQPSGNPSTAPSIRLRGSTNLLGSQSPLIIVDGVITDGSLADINMEDVKSIEVVKGAAASSLYGSLAGNGVIQVITKRGEGNRKPEVVIRAELGYSELAREYPVASKHFYQLDENGDFILNSGGQLTEDVADPDGLMDNDYPFSYNNQKNLITSQPWRTLSASISGTNEAFNYYLSYQNLNQEGIIDGLNPYNRNSFKWNMDVLPTDKVKISSTINYIQSEGATVREQGQGSSNLFFSILTYPQYMNLGEKDENGKYVAAPTNSTWFDGNFDYSPVYYAKNVDRGADRERIIGGLNLDYTVTDWLTFQAGYSIDSRNEQSWLYIAKGFQSREPDPALNNGSLSISNQRVFTKISSAAFIARKKFGDFNTALTFKYLYEDRGLTGENAASSNFSALGVRSLQNGDQTTFAISNYTYPEKAENFFVNADVDYQDKIIASGLIRRDGSSLFGEDNRYRYYYRGSLAYRITEDFTIPSVNELKVRASYGTSGQRPSIWDAQYETYSVTQSGIVGRNLGNKLLQPSVVAELELGLNATIFDRFNIEFNYSKQNVSDDVLQVPLSPATGFSFRYDNAADLESTAWEAMISGTVVTSGDFSWDANFNWSTNETIVTSMGDVAPFTRNTGTAIPIFRVEPGQPYGTIYGRQIVTSFNQLVTDDNGIVLNDPYYRTGGVGATVDDYMINEDGYVVRKAFYNTSNENVLFVSDETGAAYDKKIGDTNPDFIVGFGNTFSYKDLSLYVLLDYQKGADIYNYTKQLLYFNYRHEDQVQYGEIGKHRNYSGPSSQIYYGQGATSHFVEDGTFLKVREISLSYVLKPSAIGINSFKSARISLSGRNLFTFTKYSGWDPEVALGNNPTNFRVDEYSYPNFRTYTASIQLKF